MKLLNDKHHTNSLFLKDFKCLKKQRASFQIRNNLRRNNNLKDDKHETGFEISSKYIYGHLFLSYLAKIVYNIIAVQALCASGLV